MKTYPVTLPELGVMTGTRAIAGFGLGLLLSAKLTPEQRKPFGWGVFAVGSVIYITLVVDLILRIESEKKCEALRLTPRRHQRHDGKPAQIHP